MELAQFARKHKIKLNKSVILLCQKGIKMMKKGTDGLHDNHHIQRMFEYFSKLIKKNPSIRKKIDLEAILLGIVWHDTWKVRKTSTNPILRTINDLYEGLGSAKLFKKHALKVKLDRTTVERVFYSIRKHSNLQFFPTRTIEAKILQDLDEIEFWNHQRVLNSKNKMFFENLGIYKFLRKLFYKLRLNRRLYFSHLESEFSKLKSQLIKNI